MTSKNLLSFTARPKPNKTIWTKIIEFFPTSEGRKYAHWMSVVFGVGTIVVTYLPETIFFEEYQQFFLTPSLTDITPKDVSDEHKDRMNEAASKLKIRETKKRMIRTFTVSGFDVREFGALSSIYGGWIGIPANYFYKTVDDIPKYKMVIQNEPIKWGQDIGQQLQDSLILTDSEQTFAFGRSLLELNSHRVLLNTIIASSAAIATFAMGQYVNIKFRMFKRPYYIRYAAYPVIALIGYGLFGFTTDFYTFRREKSIDTKLAELGPEMVEAGISFYTKLINKNNAVRELNGIHTKNDNENGWLGFRRIPITQRKAFFESKLKELRQQQQEMETATQAV